MCFCLWSGGGREGGVGMWCGGEGRGSEVGGEGGGGRGGGGGGVSGGIKLNITIRESSSKCYTGKCNVIVGDMTRTKSFFSDNGSVISVSHMPI